MTRLRVVANQGEQPYSMCKCGARGGIVYDLALCQVEPILIPAGLHESCTCPRCFTCKQLLDAEGRCDNLHCLNLGLHVLCPLGENHDGHHRDADLQQR